MRPCQDLSVAGKREGLAGARSGLYWEIIRIAREMREATEGRYPAFIVLENVPGLLSSNGGRDFAEVLRGLAELGAAVAWRILDARFFGVPQRRRRVFIIADFAPVDLGEQRLTEILSFTEGFCGHSQESRTQRQGAARDAQAGAGVVGFKESQSGTRESDVVGVLDANYGSRRHNGVMAPVAAEGGNRTSGEIDVATALNAHGGPNGEGIADDQAHTLDGGPQQAVAFHLTQDPISGAESPALGTGSTHGQASIGVAISENQRAEVRETDYSRQITTGGGKPGQGYPAVRAGMTVRRLTPTECARLQGFPDDWVRFRADGSVIPDDTQYRLLGNAVAVPVIRWIGRRLRAVMEHRA